MNTDYLVLIAVSVVVYLGIIFFANSFESYGESDEEDDCNGMKFCDHRYDRLKQRHHSYREHKHT